MEASVRSLSATIAAPIAISTPPTARCASATTSAFASFSPDEAARRMTVPEGFRVKLVAAEPMIRQPVAMEFDDRGRLWVVEMGDYPRGAEGESRDEQA